MKSCFLRVVVIVSLICMVTPTVALANSMPVYMHRYPSFEIAPMTDSPLEVEHELLTFDIADRSSSEAMVTAHYTLINPTNEALIVPMIFPFVSEGYGTSRPQIMFNGNALDYEIYGAGSVNIQDYLANPTAFADQVDVNTIIDTLNTPSYETTHIDDSQSAILYEITFSNLLDRQSRVSFRIDPLRTKVVASNYSGMEGSADGKVAFTTYVGPNSGSMAYILVLGEDTLENLSITPTDTIQKTEVVIKSFLMDQVIDREDGWFNLNDRNADNLYSILLQELERPFFEEDIFYAYRNLEDIVTNALVRNNISAFFYEVDVEAASTNSLIISYPMTATIDRRSSMDYVHTFAYILNPARNFASFGTLDIEIRLNESAPFVVESSIPLQEIERGRFVANLSSLPAVDLVFTTYVRPEVTFLERSVAQFLPRGYMFVLVIMFIGTLLAVAALIFGARKLLSRRN